MYVPTSMFVFIDETCNVWLPKLTLSCTTLVTQFSYFMIDLCNYNMYSCICMYAHTHILVMCRSMCRSMWEQVKSIKWPACLDGISITHGSPRRHLWSFAANWHEQWRGTKNYICLCARPDADNLRWYIPDFVSTYYYCEIGFVTYHENRIASAQWPVHKLE